MRADPPLADSGLPASSLSHDAGLGDQEKLRRLLAEIAGEAVDIRSTETTARVRALLKDTLASGRQAAEQSLLADHDGLRCAERLSRLQDEVIGALADFVAAHVFRQDNPSDSEHVAILAVGGYGRGTLAPGSDIDLLFLLPYKRTAWGESVIEYILYMLWDLGQKVGHATRSVAECIRSAKDDTTICTSILEARHLWGDPALHDELMQRFDREVARGTAVEFVAAKLNERDQRHRRAGNTRYLVEPNIKESKGGQRDLHTLYWIGKYVYRVRSPRDLVSAGVFDRNELRRFEKCEEFQWRVRCHLHFLTGRAEERLSFDVQAAVALRMGYRDNSALRAVERFMKHYFMVAKTVGDLTRILSAALEARHVKPPPLLNRFVRRFRGQRPVEAPDYPDFLIVNNRLTLRDDQVFERAPINLIKLFAASEALNVSLHPDALRAVTRSLHLLDSRLADDPAANAVFLELLTSHDAPELRLRAMNEAGVLGRFVPEFGRVIAMMQFNMYHHYTVDEHLLRSIAILSDIENGRLKEEHPLATEVFATIQSRRVIYVALFLHDIAKGRAEDHSLAGEKVARRLAPRFGLTAAETDTVAWLVREHLTMSTIAQSRDLSDPLTISAFATTVQSLERLKLLLILTVADIRAVGPGVFNGWKGQLLRTLYYETEPVLAGGHSQIDRSHRVEAAKADLAAVLSTWSDEDRADVLARHYPPYWLKVETSRKVAHTALLRDSRRSGLRLATSVETDAFRAITELTVLAPDHPRLLATIAGACAAAGANIVDAQIFTTTRGEALDTIFLTRAFEREDEELARTQRVANSIRDVLSGKLRLAQLVAERLAKRPRYRHFEIEPDVLVNNSWSDAFTVVEVSGLDRPGLLYDLTTALSNLDLNIGSAHIATFGERAVDVFYVTNLLGGKIQEKEVQVNIRAALLAVFSDSPPPAR